MLRRNHYPNLHKKTSLFHFIWCKSCLRFFSYDHEQTQSCSRIRKSALCVMWCLFSNKCNTLHQSFLNDESEWISRTSYSFSVTQIRHFVVQHRSPISICYRSSSCFFTTPYTSPKNCEPHTSFSRIQKAYKYLSPSAFHCNHGPKTWTRWNKGLPSRQTNSLECSRSSNCTYCFNYKSSRSHTAPTISTSHTVSGDCTHFASSSFGPSLSVCAPNKPFPERWTQSFSCQHRQCLFVINFTNWQLTRYVLLRTLALPPWIVIHLSSEPETLTISTIEHDLPAISTPDDSDIVDDTEETHASGNQGGDDIPRYIL